MFKLSNIKDNIYKIIVWILTGLVLSLTISFMFINKSTSYDSIYNVGDVYEIDKKIYKCNITREYGHQEDTGKIVLDQGYFDHGIIIKANKNKWKYLCIDIEKLSSSSSINCEITYEKRKEENVVSTDTKRFKVVEGMNLFSVSHNSFNILRIKFCGDNGDSFYIKNIELRETKPVFNSKIVTLYIIMCFIIYSLIFWVLQNIFKKCQKNYNVYSCINLLQEIYLSFDNFLINFSKNFLPQIKLKSMIRTTLFLIMFLYNVWVEMKWIYYDKFKYHILVYSIILLFIAVLSIERPLRKKDWNNALVWSWLVLWIMACISDFLIPKEFRFVGYMMVFVVGPLIFVWNNMKNPQDLIADFIKSVHIFFGFIIVFCLMCRPEIENFRYSGISTNPSIFALYLLTIWAVILCELENQIRQSKNKLRLLFCIIEGCVVVVFSWKSQSAGPLLCMIILAFIWFFKMVICLKHKKKQGKLIAVVICALLLLLPSYIGINYGLNHIPETIGHPIRFENDKFETRQTWGMTVYASDIKDKIEDSRLGKKFKNATLSGILSGRDYYYRTYLRDMNLVGHKERPTMWGSKRLPHNAVIGIAHRYGVFASIPYILMLLATIVNTFKYSKKNIKYSSAPFFICLSSIIISMTDNVEQPFVWLPWIGLYLMMGVGFTTEAESEKSL